MNQIQNLVARYLFDSSICSPPFDISLIFSPFEKLFDLVAGYLFDSSFCSIWFIS